MEGKEGREEAAAVHWWGRRLDTEDREETLVAGVSCGSLDSRRRDIMADYARIVGGQTGR